MIKNRSAAYLLKKWRPQGKEEKEDEERGSGGGGGGWWGGGRGSSIRCI